MSALITLFVSFMILSAINLIGSLLGITPMSIEAVLITSFSAAWAVTEDKKEKG